MNEAPRPIIAAVIVRGRDPSPEGMRVARAPTEHPTVH